MSTGTARGVRPDAVPLGIRATVRHVGGLVDARLRAELRDDHERYAPVGASAPDVVEAVRTAVFGGGKRLRPALAFLGFTAAGGAPGDPRVIDLGAALELLHTAYLVHDDVMDDSPTRRGAPTTHARFGETHLRSAYAGEPRRFGEGVAITVGDYAFFGAMGLLAGSGPQAQREFFEMAKDVCVGQYLDLLAAARPAGGGPDPEVIARYKTARYTVQGPLRLGAAVAGRLPELGGAFSAYGRCAGLAFQLRDDLIGALGDPAVSGKPVGDDLRQGKRTPLLAFARERLADDHRARARPGPGAADLLDRIEAGRLPEAEIPAAQDLLRDLGVHDRVRRECAALAAEAVAALGPVDLDGRAEENLRQFASEVADVSGIGDPGARARP